jgi:hypothetical protein
VLKKLSLISVITLLAYSQVGYYFLIRHYQHEQKESIKEKIFGNIDEKELDMISINDLDGVKWEDDGKEFAYKGHMYDVVKRKTVSGKEILYCINDVKEKYLIDQYNQLTKHNTSDSKKGKNSPDNNFNLFVYTFDETGLAAPAGKKYFYRFDVSLSETDLRKFSPPPKG